MSPEKYRSLSAFKEFEQFLGEPDELAQAVTDKLEEYGDLRKSELVEGFGVPTRLLDKALWLLRQKKLIEIVRGATAAEDLISLHR
jgi:hypothetical protein